MGTALSSCTYLLSAELSAEWFEFKDLTGTSKAARAEMVARLRWFATMWGSLTIQVLIHGQAGLGGEGGVESNCRGILCAGPSIPARSRSGWHSCSPLCSSPPASAPAARWCLVSKMNTSGRGGLVAMTNESACCCCGRYLQGESKQTTGMYVSADTGVCAGRVLVCMNDTRELDPSLSTQGL